jgi:hypothetical protein
MPITITIHLLNGEELTYSARTFRGCVQFFSHQDAMENMVLQHFGMERATHYVEFIHEDEEEAYIDAFHQEYPYILLSNEEILRTREDMSSTTFRQVKYGMEMSRAYTMDTLIHAVVQAR